MIYYQFFSEDKFILSIFYGDVSSEELHELIDKLQKIDQKKGGMRGLNILCNNIKASGIKARDIMSAGERMQRVNFRKNGKNAIVAKTLLTYGLSRMYKVATDMSNQDELKIYKEKGLTEAINWLGVNHLSEQIQRIIDECESNTTL